MSDEKKGLGNPNWTKGVSGNPSGKRALKILTDRVRMELVQNPHRVEKIAQAIIQKAEEGDLAATTLIWNRLEGMPHQTLAIDQTITEMSREERIARILELGSKLRVIDHAPSASDDPPPPSLPGPYGRRQ